MIKVSSSPSTSRAEGSSAFENTQGPSQMDREVLLAQRLRVESATASDIKGPVFLLREGAKEKVPLTTDMTVRQGDTVLVEKGGAARLNFNDGSMTRLGEQTVFNMKEGSRTPNAATSVRG